MSNPTPPIANANGGTAVGDKDELDEVDDGDDGAGAGGPGGNEPPRSNCFASLLLSENTVVNVAECRAPAAASPIVTVFPFACFTNVLTALFSSFPVNCKGDPFPVTPHHEDGSPPDALAKRVYNTADFLVRSPETTPPLRIELRRLLCSDELTFIISTMAAFAAGAGSGECAAAPSSPKCCA